MNLKQWCFLDDDGNLQGPLSKRFEQAIRLEGTKAHASKHAAGVVISPTPLAEICPMVLDSSTKNQMAGFEMEDLEAIGLIKMDILGITAMDQDNGCSKYPGNRPPIDFLPHNKLRRLIMVRFIHSAYTRVAQLFEPIELEENSIPEFPLPFDSKHMREYPDDDGTVMVPLYTIDKTGDTYDLARLEFAKKIEEDATNLLYYTAEGNGEVGPKEFNNRGSIESFWIHGRHVWLNPRGNRMLKMVMPFRNYREFRDNNQFHISIELGMAVLGLDKDECALVKEGV